MKKNNLTIRHAFTLLELIVAMGVFSILSIVLFQIFGQMQTVYTNSTARMEAFDKGTFILDLIARDLRNVTQSQSTMRSFYFPVSGELKNDEEATRLMGFACSARFRPSPDCFSRVCEVTYFFDEERGRLYYRLIGDDMRTNSSATSTSGLSKPNGVYFNFLEQQYSSKGNPFLESGDRSISGLRGQVWARDPVWINGEEKEPDFNTNQSPAGRFVLIADCVYKLKVDCIDWRTNSEMAAHWRRPTMRYVSFLNREKSSIFKARNDGLFPIPDMMNIEIQVVPSNVWQDVLIARDAGNTTRADELAQNAAYKFKRLVSNMCTPIRGENNDKTNTSIPTHF